MKARELGIQIAVLDNGFVYVGRCSIDAKFLTISDAKNLRRWGTKNGLGELRSGPTKETIADKCGTILVPVNRVCHFIACDGGWNEI